MFLGDDEFDRIRPFLRATDELSQGYPHPRPYQSYRVVYYKEDDIYAINPDDYSDRIPLTKSDVIVYEFDMQKFRETLAKMLGFHASKDDYEQYARSLPLGYWEPDGGAEYPVHLLFSNNYHPFPTLVHRLFVMDETPMIILTPTRKGWDDETLELFRKRRSVVASLEEIMDINSDGAWTASEHWLEILTHFYNEINPLGMVAAPPPFEFRRKGEYWIIRFDGEEMFLKDALGLRCIAQLLAKPNEPVFVSDLKMIVDGQNPENLPAPTSAGEVADPEYLRDVARKYITCEMEYNDAKDRGETALAKEIQDEMTKLMDFLREAKGFGGRAKEANEQLNSIRVAIYRAVSRTLESIKVELPDCFRHFSRTISTGLVLNYTSEMKYPWIL